MQCTKCKSEILSTDKFCPHCGDKVESQGKTCSNPKCNRSGLPDEAIYCPDCGTKCDSSVKLSDFDESNEQSDSKIQIKNGNKYQPKETETLLPLADVYSSELERKKRRRIPIAGIIGIIVFLLALSFFIFQFVVGQKYDHYIKLSEDAIRSGDCENAIENYSKANEQENYLLYKDKVSLNEEISECRYKTALNHAEKIFSDLTLNISDVETANDAFQEARQFKNTEIVESRIIFCEKLILALKAQSDEEWISALDYYGEVMNYARSNDVNDQIISEIKSEKAKILTPKAKIIEVTRKSNVWRDEEKGMVIHVKFETLFMKDRQGRATAWFYYEDGEKLQDENDTYCTPSGQVSCGEDFEPSYKESNYNGFELFIPYRELHLSSGSTDLKLRVGIFCEHEKLATSDYLSFTMTYH